MTWQRDEFLKRLDEYLNQPDDAVATAEPGDDVSVVSEIMFEVKPGEVAALKGDVELAKDAEGHVGQWTDAVLGHEQRTNAVVALVVSRVNEEVRVREARRHRQMNFAMGILTIAVTVLLTVAGWVGKEIVVTSLGAGIDARLDARANEDARSQAELELNYILASALATEFEDAKSISDGDRDQIMRLIESIHGHQLLIDREGFAELLKNSVLAFAQANQRHQVDRIFELYPEICLANEDIVSILLQEYGGRLAGHDASASGWPHIEVEIFERVSRSLPSRWAPELLVMKMIVSTRGYGSSDESVRNAVESAALLQIRADGADGRQEFVEFLFNRSHWMFLATRSTRSVVQQAISAREAINEHRAALYEIADAVDSDLLASIVSEKVFATVTEGEYAAEEVTDLIETMQQLFEDRPDVQQGLAQVKDVLAKMQKALQETGS